MLSKQITHTLHASSVYSVLTRWASMIMKAPGHNAIKLARDTQNAQHWHAGIRGVSSKYHMTNYELRPLQPLED
jgi:hypothetical protein